MPQEETKNLDVKALEIKNKVFELIDKYNYKPLTFEGFVKELDLEEEDYLYLREALISLVNESKLFENRKHEYLNDLLANKFIGTISIKNEDYGFVSNKYCDDFYVDSYDFLDAMDKDIVLYSVSDYHDGYRLLKKAKVLKIIKRYFEYLVGEISYENTRTYLLCNEKGLSRKVLVSKLNDGKVGDIVRTKIISYDYFLKVEVIEVLGSSKELGMDITQIVAKMNIPYVFPDDVIKEANTMQNDALSQKYEVFNQDLIFTIDGLDAKDLDDAVSISKNDNGNYNVGVYIADVSHYVTENSFLDIEALNRGTSIYLVDRVIPMLPVKLSNDLCSLNPNQEKLVMALFMEVNNKGDVVDSYVKEGVIKTTKRLSYEVCNEVFSDGLINHPDMEIAYNSLQLMKELSEILTIKRDKRGSINFDVDEPKIIVDEKGKAIDIVLRERGISEKIIEELMILANEQVAYMIYTLDLPFIYRVHEEPDLVKFHLLKELVSNLGYSVKSLHPKELQKLLSKIDKNKEHSYLKNSILRLMNKAVYSEDNIGHFGLASRCYTHFTSPIRRYPDLLVHRLLRKYLLQNEVNVDNQLKDKISKIATKASDREKRAIECEYKVLDLKKAEYMEQYVGETFEGIVSTILKFGIFITLSNTVDGLLRSKSLLDCDYKYSMENNCYINYKTNQKIMLGSTVKVILDSVNKKLGEIDFKLVYNLHKKDKFQLKSRNNTKNIRGKSNYGQKRKYKDHRK